MNYLVSAWLLFCASCALEVHADDTTGLHLFVAPGGNDEWSGSRPEPNSARTDGPLATLEQARNIVRQWRKNERGSHQPVLIELRAGTYELSQPLELSRQDSGTRRGRVTYQAYNGETVLLSGGRTVRKWSPVSNRDLLARLDEKARGHVYQADLKALGINDFGSLKQGGLELYFNGRPMTLARWPNQGFVKIVDVVKGKPFKVHGKSGDRIGKFVYEGDRPRRWQNEDSIWLHGFWFWDWSDERQEVFSIDVERRTISIKPPYHHYGYRKGQWFYAYNLLAELDMPGEWYLDRTKGVIYFWPPSSMDSGQAVVSVTTSLLSMRDVSNVTFRDLRFEYTRGTAVSIRNGAECLIEHCTLRNLGGSAIAVSDGTRHGITDCHLEQLGVSGISLSGGNRKTLRPSQHFARNNHIHNYGLKKRTYSRAIALNGVGNRAEHNLIHHAPHQAIAFGGNDHRIEFNEIHNVCLESNDAGAIYAGRDWTMRGTVIRHNYLHDITGFQNRGCVGVYLDDMFCGTEIVGNVFFRVTRAAFIGGGRDVTIANNIFVDCKPAIHVDARALGWAHGHSDMWIREGKEKGTLSGIAYGRPPYRTRYPQLVDILQDEPAAPKGNIIERNISAGGVWADIDATAGKYVHPRNNLISGDPRFVDRKGHNFQLRSDSPAWKLGFERIPIERIGLIEDKHTKTEAPD